MTTVATRWRYERILSLDGGGTWALIQVRALMDLFGADASGHDVLRNFDLVAANSGGSIVAAALAVNKTLAETLALFVNEAARKRVFRKSTGHLLPWPRYSEAAKYDGLREVLGPGCEIALTAWHAQHPKLAHILIPAFDYDVTRAAFFRSDAASLAASRSSAPPATATLLDAVDASANPPVLYFDGPAVVPAPGGGERRYWDGAIGGYNNPAMAGVIEALTNGSASSKIRVLTVGTGTVRRPRRPPGASLHDPRYEGGGRPGLFRDAEKLAGAVLDDPPDAASFMAHVTLGGRLPRGDEVVADGPVVRMSPVVRPVLAAGQWQWPPALSEEQWVRLTQLGLDSIAPEDVDLIGELCSAWLETGPRTHKETQAYNQPIRAGLNLLAEIGHDTYAAARAAAAKWIYRGTLFHIVGAAEWGKAERVYRPAGFAEDGFVHLSTAAQLLTTAVRFFAGRPDLVVLCIDPEALDASKLTFEAADGAMFPHFHGELPLDAVVDVAPLTPANSRFEVPQRWVARRKEFVG
jgi:uncharacterized protein